MELLPLRMEELMEEGTRRRRFLIIPTLKSGRLRFDPEGLEPFKHVARPSSSLMAKYLDRLIEGYTGSHSHAGLSTYLGSPRLLDVRDQNPSCPGHSVGSAVP